MLKSSNKVISGCAAVDTPAMSRWLFLSSSQSGWCRLKSPHYIMQSDSEARTDTVWCCINNRIVVSEFGWTQSLYMLKMVSQPCGSWNCNKVMLFEPSRGTWAHVFMSSSTLTRITDLQAEPSVRWEDR